MSFNFKKISDLNRYTSEFKERMNDIYKEYFDHIKESIREKANKTYNAKYNNIFNEEIYRVIEKRYSYEYLPYLYQIEVTDHEYDTEIFNEYMEKWYNLDEDQIKEEINSEISAIRDYASYVEENETLIDNQIMAIDECLAMIVIKEKEFIEKYKIYKDIYYEAEAIKQTNNSNTINDETLGEFDYRELKSITDKFIKNTVGLFGTTKKRCIDLQLFKYRLFNTLNDILYSKKKSFESLILKANSMDHAISQILEDRKSRFIEREELFINDDVYSCDNEYVIDQIINLFKEYINKLIFYKFIDIEDESDEFNLERNKYINFAIIDNPVYIELMNNISNLNFKSKFLEVVQDLEFNNGINLRNVRINVELEENLSVFWNNKFRREEIKIYINSIISNLTTGISEAIVHNILIDKRYAGKYFTQFNEIRNLNSKIFGEKIFMNEYEINNILSILNDEIIRITHNKLNNKYDNIHQYNKENHQLAEPIRLITIIGGSNIISKHNVELLTNIAINGPKCGINLLIDYEEDFIDNIYLNYINTLKQYMTVFNVEEKMIGIEGTNINFNEFNVLENKNNIYNLLKEKALYISEKEKKALNLNSIGSDCISDNVAEELIIPIGKNNKGEVQSIRFGKGVSHHGLIAGQTGSGKSTLLHTIILSSIKNYEPEDLNIYLMDFKEGIEFKIYADHKIPHIKLIALESQVEFGESILEFMIEEIQSRGRLFKENGVENLKSYKEKTGKKLPRILMIIDEFTNLFNVTNGRAITGNNAQLMKKIILQGRAFGVNVLMASQSIRDTSDSTLTPETIEQMAVRIGLKCTDKDAAALMGSENFELNRLGSEMGLAIYNNENGRGENSKFKIAYCDNDEKKEIIKAVANRYVDRYETYKCRVFDGNSSVDVANDINSVFNDDSAIRKNTLFHEVWLGEPIKIGEDVSIKFTQGQNNLLIISNRDIQSQRILTYSIISIIRQVRLQEKTYDLAAISLLDYNYNIGDNSIAFNHIIEGNKDLIQTMDDDSAKNIITNLYKEFVRRRDNNLFKENPMYLMINGLQKARDILIKSKSRPFSLLDPIDSDENELGVMDMFEALIKDGGDFGIFLIMTCDTYRSYGRVIDKIGYWLKESINLKIAFNMSSDDGEKFIGEQSVESLNENTAILYDDVTGIKNKFRIYSEPTKEWIADRYTNNKINI